MERKRFRDETSKSVKQVMKAEPLYKQIEQRFNEEIRMPELDEQIPLFAVTHFLRYIQKLCQLSYF